MNFQEIQKLITKTVQTAGPHSSSIETVDVEALAKILANLSEEIKNINVTHIIQI